jgi:glycosyltransferase involved in cell wall biosynthesis
MIIGIVPVTNPGQGGIYQYSQTMLDVLKSEVLPGSPDRFMLFVKDPASPQVETMRSSGWEVHPLFPPGGIRRFQLTVQQRTGVDIYNKAWRIWQQITHGAGIDHIRRLPDVTRWLDQFKVDLVIYPAPDELAFETGIPYVMAVHDLQHRLQPHFPEISASGNLYWREYLFRNAARFATLLISESEVGKQDILNFYGASGITDQRIKVMPFLPAVTSPEDVPEKETRRVKSAYQLPERYLFYPAQFWPHKNHARIVQALNLLRLQRQITIPVVFAGTYTGRQRSRNYRKLKTLIHELDMADQVILPGYVPDADMPGLYAGAAALVMLTFFGPSNIPVLEAWAYGCPVISSDIHGIREQCGEAALFVDPNSVDAIAQGIFKIWTDHVLAGNLAEKGKNRIASYTRQDYARLLCDILEEAKRLVSARDRGADR